MSDLVSKHEVIDALESWAVVIGRPQFFLKEDAIHVIESLPTVDAEPKWIPWQEGMPAEGEEVLVTDGHHIWIDSMTSVDMGEYGMMDYYWDDDQGVTPIDDTAWMPLPEPWKGAEDV